MWQCLGGCQSQSSYGYALHSSHILIFVDEFTPLSPSSDLHQFSPNNIHTLSREKVMRIAKMITKEKKPWSFIKFSEQILKGNVWRSAWRICMWILGLKGLIANNLEFTVWLHCGSIIPFVNLYFIFSWKVKTYKNNIIPFNTHALTKESKITLN